MNVWRCKRWAGENGVEMEQNQQTPRLRRVRHNTQRLYGAKRFDSNRMVTGTVVRFFEYLVNILFIDMVYSVSWNTSLPAGWSFIAVGPSRFHVMFGFGEPFFPDATTHQQPTSQRADSNRTESELKENRTKRDTEKYIFEKEVEEDRKKRKLFVSELLLAPKSDKLFRRKMCSSLSSSYTNLLLHISTLCCYFHSQPCPSMWENRVYPAVLK